MNIDRYNHIGQKFDLELCMDTQEIFTVKTEELFVQRSIYSRWVIDSNSLGEFVFCDIETEQLAKEILQYIKDTEILFV